MHEVIGENNLISVPENSEFNIRIFGNNNSVIFDNTTNLTGRCIIYGNNVNVRIGKNVRGYIVADIGGNNGRNADNTKLIIEDNVHLGDVTFQLMEKNSEIEIKKRCIFARGIKIFCSDTHSIVDKNGNLLNPGKFVKIDEHVWCGADVKIGKNTLIPRDSVIGWGSVVTKQFLQPNVIIAGNPARVVKTGINWNGDCPDMYQECIQYNNGEKE